MQASAGSLAQGREVTEIPAELVDQMFDIFEDLLAYRECCVDGGA